MLALSSQVVDGAVSESGGRALDLLRAALPTVDARGRKCLVGSAAGTGAPGGLAQSYKRLVHAVPPFRSAGDWAPLLARTYDAALHLAANGTEAAAGPRPADVGQGGDGGFSTTTVAAPLLGAGARGAKAGEAAAVAVAAITAWRGRPGARAGPLVRFGCIEKHAVDCLEAAVKGSGQWEC